MRGDRSAAVGERFGGNGPSREAGRREPGQHRDAVFGRTPIVLKNHDRGRGKPARPSELTHGRAHIVEEHRPSGCHDSPPRLPRRY